ncbi:putative transcription elongation factor SPT5 homolog 1 [Malus sylvestris]|uniref:putative transcription elongation factor SPT5 homolog 1 n=1 Tax=Malus sylvestris TaxID=3752 RepID=UPI0021AC3E18|nr:putative transcription elongation factor SPT5 homolog 1 [Malus sylvestris]
MKRRGRENSFYEQEEDPEEALFDDEDGEEKEEERQGGGSDRKRRRSDRREDFASKFLDIEAEVDSEEEDYESEPEDDGFIAQPGDDPNPSDGEDDDDVRRAKHGRLLFPEELESEGDIEELERRVQGHFDSHQIQFDDGDDDDEIGQQARLPCVRDPKLWMVKCAIGHEREVALCLAQKCINQKSNPSHMIRSAIALDNLKNYIYVEADKEAHVREACKGMRYVFTAQKIVLVPIKEMVGVVSVERKPSVDVSVDSWVRMKRVKMYEGDLGRVVDVDDVRRRVTVKLIPRIDFPELARKLEGLGLQKKRFIPPPARLMNIDEAERVLAIQVKETRDRETGEYFDKIGDMKFKHGFLYKTVAMSSISWHNVNPTFDELEKFRKPAGNENADRGDDMFSNRYKGEFMKGDAVVVEKGDLINLAGRVEKVEGGNVHMRPDMKGLPETLVINKNNLCKYFKIGNHVKVTSGSQKGAAGMVVKVDQQHGLVTIITDKTKKHVCVFADDVVESFGATGDDANGVSSFSRFGHYRTPSKFSGGRRRGPDANGLDAGTRVKIRQGVYKGYRGRVVEVKGQNLLVELESQMKIVTVDRRSCVSDSDNFAAFGTLYRYGNGMRGTETPMRDPRATPLHSFMTTPMRDPNATPLHSYMTTPMRDPRETPIHDGMKTPMLY